MKAHKEPQPIADVARELFNFAVDREDIKALVQAVPEKNEEGPPVNKTLLEYELPLLKIVCTGWAVSYYLADHPAGKELARAFWDAVQKFSRRVSEISQTAAAVDIDYFERVKERADLYTRAMQMNMTQADPAGVIGITFAEACGSKTDPLVVAAGKSMFVASLESVRRYLDKVDPRSEENTGTAEPSG